MTQKELFEQYHRDVYRTCYYMLKNQHDAEDVCQEVFVKILQQDYDVIANLQPWILSITMNACRNYMRKRSKVFLLSEVSNWFLSKADPQRVEEQVEVQEQREEIAGYLHKLSAKIREVMVLKYLHELKNEEIATMLSIPLGTVKSRANKGILQLRSLMELDHPAVVLMQRRYPHE
jgi:RNA polymerase sigma factor (sigma-70 family)